MTSRSLETFQSQTNWIRGTLYGLRRPGSDMSSGRLAAVDSANLGRPDTAGSGDGWERVSVDCGTGLKAIGRGRQFCLASANGHCGRGVR